MSFTPLIPASGQSLGNSRTQVLNNFASLRTTLSNVLQPNHIDVNSSGAGKHIFLQMPVKTSGANNLTVTGEFGMIAQAVSGVSELFASRDGGAYFQLTAGTPTVAASGKTFLPGGLILQWGVNGAISNGASVSFSSAFPNACFGVQVTINTASTLSPVGINGFSTTGFTFRTTAAGSVPITYLAIGN